MYWCLSSVINVWMSSRSRSSSRSSTNQNLTPNGRKRKLSSQTSVNKTSASQSSSRKTKRKDPDFSPSTKRRRISLTQSVDSQPGPSQPGPSGVRKYFSSVQSDSEEESDEYPIYLHTNTMATTPSPVGHLNNKTNSFKNHKTATGLGTNNHTKKPGGAKKLVIKNRKSKFIKNLYF